MGDPIFLMLVGDVQVLRSDVLCLCLVTWTILYCRTTESSVQYERLSKIYVSSPEVDVCMTSQGGTNLQEETIRNCLSSTDMMELTRLHNMGPPSSPDPNL